MSKLPLGKDNLDIQTVRKIGYMKFVAVIGVSSYHFSKPQLLKAMDTTQIHTFGWPIGIVFHETDLKPYPTESGIESKVEDPDRYDFWTLKINGEFCYFGSYFEDMRTADKLFFDTRVVRITETIWRTVRLYKTLGIRSEDYIGFRFIHGGLKNRRLTVANPRRVMTHERICKDAEKAESDFSITLGEMISENNEVNKENMKRYVFETIEKVTHNFDFFEPNRSVVDEIVDSFLNGRIS
jgi:hypothetical protein